MIVLSDQWDNIGSGSGSRSQVWEEVKCENGVEGGSPLLAWELSQEILHFFFFCVYTKKKILLHKLMWPFYNALWESTAYH